ncbi:zinc finger protein 638 [Hemicordylus capensis]|uniref:zinc finger protein 638 n=1 Tax=Hemicordylus capensis TaxID=884348 RepID=UPI00230481DD|nr:zinc finger protein 638 [Hemicordylus capensis]
MQDGKRTAGNKGHGAQLPLDPLRRFVVLLESFAPLVNSLNLGIASPLLLGPPPLQLAQIKTQLALHQLNLVASNHSVASCALLNKAFLKIAMFNPRGNIPPRPRGPTSGGPTPRGPFQESGPRPGGLQRQPPTNPHGMPQRFTGSEMKSGFSGPNVQVTQHRMDPRQTEERINIQRQQKEENRTSRWDNNYQPGNSSRSQPASGRIAEHTTSVQSRYTNESASSILASFGLSNEDLEELSRYPDDQLTPENMPLILRDIRMRKMGLQLPDLSSQSREKETFRSNDNRGSMMKSKVIDYGHESKYGYSEGPLEVKVYSSEVPTEENMKGFQAQQTASVTATPSSVPNNPLNAVEELIRRMGFQRSTPTTQPFFPMGTASELPGLCLPSAGPGIPPPVQPIMPPVVLPLPPPVMPPVVQQVLPPPPVAQPMMPIMNQPPPPFVPGIFEAVKRQNRIQHESRGNLPNASPGPTTGQKNFQKKAENPIASPFGVVKASWLPVFSQADAQKMKRLPTPSMMNDYYAASPRIFPHMCSLCNVECRHLKNWIQHQNTTAHIESCRQLRQQYPDWNPESLSSSKRRESDRKENNSLRRRSDSSSPRRSSSSHARQRSRSRSRTPGYRRTSRPRSRSPLHLSSPRHRSRSPRRFQNFSSCSRRSSSQERGFGRSATTSDEALEAAVKCLGPCFVEEFNKQKSVQALIREISETKRTSTEPHPGSMKIQSNPTTSLKPPRRDFTQYGSPDIKMKQIEAPGIPRKGAIVEGKSKKLPMGAPVKQANVDPEVPYNRLLTDKLLNCGTVLRISDLPDGFSVDDIKKVVQPFGKVNDILVLRSRNEAFLEMNYKEAVTAAVKYGSTVPVWINFKRVNISVAEKPKTTFNQNKGNVKNTEQNVKTLNTKKDQTNSTAKTAKPVSPVTSTSKTNVKDPGEPQKGGAIKSVVVDPKKKPGTMKVVDQKKLADLKKVGATKAAVEQKKPANLKKVGAAKAAAEQKKSTDLKKTGVTKATAEHKKSEEPQKAQESKKTTEPKKPVESKAKETPAHVPDPIEAVKGAKAGESSTETEEICVVVISNLPEAGLTLDEISNLTKPFGGQKDILIVSSHKKAYLEMSCKSADSMVKFYTCFPMWVQSNQLCITMAPEFKDIKDEEAIFIAMIKDANPKVNTETLHAQFVYLGNLPDGGYSELEILCVGLRFGRVDHYMVITNKNKAILQLDSAESAASMCRFLRRYPYRLGNSQLTFSRSPKIEPLPPEVMKREVRKQEPSKESPDLEKNPEGSGVVQSTAVPSAKPIEAVEEPSSNLKVKIPKVKTELSGIETVVCEAASKSSKTEASEGNPSRVAATALAVVPADSGSLEAKSQEVLALPSNLKKEEKVTDNSNNELLENVSTSAAGNGSEELSVPVGEPSEESLSVVKTESLRADSAMIEEGEGTAAPVCETVPLASAEAPMEGLQSSNKVRISEANSTEASISLPDMPAAKVGGIDKEEDTPFSTTEASVDLESQAPVTETREITKDKSELQVVEAATAAEKQPEDLVSNDGATKEKKPEKNASEESTEQILPKAQSNKGPGQAKTDEPNKANMLAADSATSSETASVSKTILKALMSVPNMSKARASPRRKEEQKPLVKMGTRSQVLAEKKLVAKEASQQKPTNSRSNMPESSISKPSISSLVVKVGSGKSSSQQDKSSQVETKGSSKQTREQESRSSSMKRDNGINKASAGRNTRSSKSSTKPMEEVELFPFNLDEFVTVDEVIDEVDSPSPLKRNPPRGKRKDPVKKSLASEPSSKRRKGKNSAACGAEGKPSFVTLDEVGEDEGGVAQAADLLNLEALPDPQALVTVDEVNDDEELISEVVQDPQSLVTLDEVSEQEEPTAHESAKDVLPLGDSEPDLKAEPLVTVDEIGEVEELPLNEPSHFKVDEALKSGEDEKQIVEDPGDFLSSQMPEDPSTLVTVDEIHEDSDDQPLVTVDEVMEEDEDFLADFNRLKEELNFVTVDEVGSEDEEEEDAASGETKGEGSVAETAPEKGAIMLVAKPEECMSSSAEPEKGAIIMSATEPEDGVMSSTEPEKEAIIMPVTEPEEDVMSSDEPEKGSIIMSITNLEEDVVSSAEPKETGIPCDILPEVSVTVGSGLPEGNEMSEAQAEAAEREGFAAEDKEIDGQKVTSVNIEKDEDEDDDVERENKKITEADKECEQPLADSSDNKERSTGEDQQPSESESHEEDIVAEATEMEAAGSPEPTSDEMKPVDEVLMLPLDLDVSTGNSQTAVVGELDTGAELPDQDLSVHPEADLKEEESCSEATPSQSSVKFEKDLTGSECEEPESKRRKVDSSEISKAPSHPKDLDFLVPKAGYFCQICSCFCVDEASMKTHCQSPLHQQNMEKFMIKNTQ